MLKHSKHNLRTTNKIIPGCQKFEKSKIFLNCLWQNKPHHNAVLSICPELWIKPSKVELPTLRGSKNIPKTSKWLFNAEFQLEAICIFSCDNLLPYNVFLSNRTQCYSRFHWENLKVGWYFLVDCSPSFVLKHYFLEYFFEKEGVFTVFVVYHPSPSNISPTIEIPTELKNYARTSKFVFFVFSSFFLTSQTLWKC